MGTIKEKLNLVYKASQCMDIEDTKQAKIDVSKIAETHGWKKALNSRYSSLQKREQFLSRKR